MKILEYKMIIKIVGAVFSIALFIFLYPAAFGQESGIVFPIPELGSCSSKDECRAYCNNPENQNQCLNFAEENGLITQEEVDRSRRFLNQTGPGGCQGPRECKAYCDNRENAQECLDFAVQQGFISNEQALRIKKRIVTNGPGGCQNESECRAYCDNPENAQECLDFAQREGLLPPQAAERAREIIDRIRNGGPGGCKSEAECRAYCEISEHQEECFEFAERHSLVDRQQIEDFKRHRDFMRKVRESGGPGGCTSEESCRLYCSDPDNTEECLNFAVKHGHINRQRALEEIERFKRGDFEDHRQRFEQERARFEEEMRKRRAEFEQRFQERQTDFQERRQELEGQFQERRNRFEREFREGTESVPSGPPQNFPGQDRFPAPEDFRQNNDNDQGEAFREITSFVLKFFNGATR